MILLLSQHSKTMLGREGHGRTEAIKIKSSDAAPYKPQSHPLSAVVSFPASHLFLLGQGQWDLAHLEMSFPWNYFLPARARALPITSSRAVQTPQINNNFYVPEEKR